MYSRLNILKTFNLMKTRPLLIFGMFGASNAAYLTYDYFHHPTNNNIPIKSKKVFIPSDMIFAKKFNSEELLKKELIVRNGLLYRLDSNIPLTGSDWIYVMRSDEKIFIEHPNRRVINHTSLGYGFKIVSAGEITIKEGMVFRLNEKSGHYRPRNRVQLIESRLRELNAIFHSEYKCKNYESIPTENDIKFINAKNNSNNEIIYA